MERIRLVSLDALRGFTVAAMIMVNFPGMDQYVYPTLRHSVWNGLTFTDTIAPIFIFVVGVSIVYAYRSKLAAGNPKTPMYKKILFRTFKIFAVGVLLNIIPDFDMEHIRWTGTLQRIALVFMFCAFIFLNTNWKQQLWLTVILLTGYWLLLTALPTPGYNVAMLEPGINIVAWFDSKFLPGKMWQGHWDPESILSTIPSVATGITGMLAGQLLTSALAPAEKVNRLMTVGLFSAIAGYFWGLIFPVNENLWTSSFVLVTSGLSAMLLGAFYYIADIKGYKKWSIPGVVFGVNAITAYVLAAVLALVCYRQPVNEAIVGMWIDAGIAPPLASLLYALAFVGINYLIIYALYRKKLFIKL